MLGDISERFLGDSVETRPYIEGKVDIQRGQDEPDCGHPDGTFPAEFGPPTLVGNASCTFVIQFFRNAIGNRDDIECRDYDMITSCISAWSGPRRAQAGIGSVRVRHWNRGRAGHRCDEDRAERDVRYLPAGRTA
jgi:hypothetical protein